MSLHLVLGLGLDPAEEFHDPDRVPYVREMLAGVNRVLRDLSLPEYHEPPSLPEEVSRFGCSMKSAIMHFWSAAAAVDARAGVLLPLAEQISTDHTLFLPVPFLGALEPGPEYGERLPLLASSYQLYAECRVMVETLGFDEDWIYPLDDPTIAVLDSVAGLSRARPFPRITDPAALRREWDHVDWDNAEGACWFFHEGARLSVKHGVALELC